MSCNYETCSFIHWATVHAVQKAERASSLALNSEELCTMSNLYEEIP